MSRRIAQATNLKDASAITAALTAKGTRYTATDRTITIHAGGYMGDAVLDLETGVLKGDEDMFSDKADWYQTFTQEVGEILVRREYEAAGAYEESREVNDEGEIVIQWSMEG